MSKVHNIKGTSDRKPHKYKSWIAFWETKKGRTATQCANTNCQKSADVGGHVQKHGNETEDTWFITPLCNTCNNYKNEEPFMVIDSNLVPVSQAD